MKTIEKIIGIILVIAAIGFNLVLYRTEPTTMVDPNDNAFQYALVDRTNQVWNYADTTCPSFFLSRISCHASLLIDHWVPNWAEGYNLPYYYSHIPQILIVGSYRVYSWIASVLPITQLSLFQYYHSVIYLLLCFFPLSIFLSLRVLKLSPLTAGVGAFLASHIATDGLYGLDQSSYLWRGWGLSSQLFAAIWLPLAIAYSIRFLTIEETRRTRDYLLSILFITLTTAGHLGIGMMLFLALPVIAVTPVILKILNQEKWKTILRSLWQAVVHTIQLALPPLILLSYWIIPSVRDSIYHNISFWDPVWKFNSFGAKDVMILLFNGELFDFGRLPLFTGLVLVGIFAVCISHISNGLDAPKEKSHSLIIYNTSNTLLSPLPLLFLFYLFLFFGKTTWGSLLSLIPGMADFHQHRFIVGIHIIGLLLIPVALSWISDTLVSSVCGRLKRICKHQNVIYFFVFLLFSAGICFLVIPTTVKYSAYNDELIVKGNATFETQKKDVEKLKNTLLELQKTASGRVFAGRGGSWGKDFQVAETEMFMYLSTYGIPTVLWLPETWSLNSDIEQYFREDKRSDYELFGIRYIATPKTLEKDKIQPFWKYRDEGESWVLYEISPFSGFVLASTAPSVVSSDKESFGNLIKHWIQSDYPEKQIFPEIRIEKSISRVFIESKLPKFSMLDEATYQTPDGKHHSLFGEPPVYEKPWERTTTQKTLPMKILSQSSEGDMVFTANVEVTDSCPTCVVILKHTYHPNWKATINGKPVSPLSVFPFYTAIRLEEPGTYDIVFSYTPSKEKMILLFISPFVLLGVWVTTKKIVLMHPKKK